MRKVLVVDDEPAILNLLKNFLVGKGMDVDVAADGLEGLRMALATDYHVVVTDVQMPGISGIVLINELMKKKPNQRFVIITGYPLGETPFPVFRKPFDLKEIFETLKVDL